jgi:hypothetical protein
MAHFERMDASLGLLPSRKTIVTCITVVLSVIGLMLGVMMVAWLFGYRKSIANEAESA